MRIEQLKGCKKSAVIGWMAGMLLLAGCTQDKLADASQGEMLPEGKYPVTFTATGLEISAATRATADGTADGTWGGNEAVAVKIGDDVKEYTANSDGTTTTLEAASGVTPFYWQNTDETKSVSAWYCGTGYNESWPTTWSVKTRQDSENGYQQSDFLYAEGNFTLNGGNSLTFYHQVAKVVVNIRNYGVVSNAGTIKSVSIKAITNGTFTLPSNGGNYGLSSNSAESPTGITPFKLSDPKTGVIFDGKKGETAFASYQALVIPQALSSNTIVIQIEGYNTFTYSLTGKWEGGRQYTYNLTIESKQVSASVNPEIYWNDDSNSDKAGTGSVKL